MTLQSGRRLGPYEVLAPIGAGGMGEVYRARDTRLGREVAVKVLPEEWASDRGRLARFESEARSASALNHPNIVMIHDVGHSEGVSWIAMELVRGKTLRDLLSEGPLPVRRTLSIAAQAAEGLAAAHAAGIVHRDLKPENLMVAEEGFVKILDFGLAKLQPESAGTVDSAMLTAAGNRTGSGVILGTASYMSPEQASGKPVDYRSDQFSLGAILYEMVRGRRAFSRPTAAETMAAIIREEPEALPETGTGSTPLRWILERCLAKDPHDRYGSTRDLARDIAQAEHVSPPGTAAPAPRRRAPRMLAVGLGIVVLLALAAGLWFFQRGRSAGGAIDSLAVLPFANAGGDPDTEYLSDGITDSLIDSLSQMPSLRVISHASVFRYKGRPPEPQVVGRELGVRAVLTGSVLQKGGGLAIQAELVDARDNRHLWGERYQRKFSDVFAVQASIASEISERLKLRLSGRDKSRLARRYTEDTEAYQLYLRGRYFWNRRTAEALKKSVEYFEQAIARDPAYALAYAGLSDSYNLLGFTGYGVLPPREAYPKAKAAAQRALEIDDSLAEAHTAMAAIARTFDWDSARAEREFRRAIDLNPNYATAHQWYAHSLAETGRIEEGLREIRRAQELDPLSLIININVAWVYDWGRRPDEAMEQARKTLEMDPSFGSAHWMMGRSYQQKKMFSEAIAEHRKAVEFNGGNLVNLAWVGHACAAAGKAGEARRIIDELKQASRTGYLPPFLIALVYAGLGEKDTAFEWLERSYEQRDGALRQLKVEWAFDGIRSDPRFADLQRRVGLPP